MKTSYANCTLCDATCGLEVRHDGQRIESIRGDARDAFSQGYICPKATALKDVHEDPDRLKRPLRRVDSVFEEASWEDALATTAAEIARIQARYGRDALAVYVGNGLGHSYAGVLSNQVLSGVLGTKNLYSTKSVDALPRLLTMFQLYGHQALLPVPDLDRTDYLLVLGANPLVSNGSLMTAPDVRKRLRALRERGGKLVVLDPRRSETAEQAHEHIFIRPGCDAFFLLGLLHVLFADGLVALGRLETMVEDFDEVRAIAAGAALDRMAMAAGIEAAVIERLAHEFSAAKRAVCYGRIGTCTQRFGTLAQWLIELVNIVTGNLDRPGGAMFNTPAVDLAQLASLLGLRGSYARYRSRVQGLPEFSGELPVAALADEIETPGPSQVRALVTIAGNPVLSLPNGQRLERAFERLEFIASIDIYLNETTRHAHVILPSTFGLERDDYPMIPNAMAVRNHARYSPPILAAAKDALHDFQIFEQLALRIVRRRGRFGRVKAAALHALLALLPPRRRLELLLRFGPHGKRKRRARLKIAALGEHGLDLGPLEPRLPAILGTKSKKIALAPPLFVADLARLSAALHSPDTADGELLLIGRRHLRSSNSWMHNSAKLISGRARCTLMVNPADAARIGIATGHSARLRSRVGSIVAEVEVTDTLMPGVVSLPHGFGHGRAGTRLCVANEHAGVSVNDITDERLLDPLSGTSQLIGVPVVIERLEVR
jgi:anaerobic selenocysteine-containing dehydrogenase